MEHRAGSCPTCGRRSPRSYRHRIDAAKVSVLERVAAVNRAGTEWAKVQRDGALTRAEDRLRTIQCDDVHALRLSWFGLLQSRGRRTGEYRVTAKGARFLAGVAVVPEWIECLRGALLSASHINKTVSEVRDVKLNAAYWAEYAQGFAQ